MIPYFSLAIRNLRRRKLRSWLTVLGIFIGIAAVVSLISLGQGMQGAITEQFEMMGANKLIVMAGTGMGAMAFAEKLTVDDLEAVKEAEGVDLAAKLIYATSIVKFRDEARQTFVIGLPTDKTGDILKDMEGFKIQEGRELKDGDTWKVVIGYLVAEDDGLFKKGMQLRDNIIVGENEFRVVGIMEQIGNPQDDAQIYMPFDKAKEIFGRGDEIDTIYVQTKNGFEPADVGEEIKEELMSVLERRKEIGILKAIGANNKDVAVIFVIEAGMLGLIGGAIGIVLGLGLGKAIEYIIVQALGIGLIKISVTAPLIIGSLLFSLVIGMVSGLLPAIQASRLNPVDALRYE
ncbi:ABC transporter permease [archaeon]|nr:ABC transporter permease [archaeon]